MEAPVNPEVDAYVERSTQWPAEMAALRTVLVGCELDEELKWAKPCYAHGGRNIAIVQEMKPFLALMFFKGALLDDPEGVLEEQGPNSRSARRMTFTSVDEVTEQADVVRGLVAQAIAAEAAGLSVPAADELELVAELRARLDADADLRAAFEGLTPGRQREYHLHIASAKQSATRHNRIDRVIPRILAGLGLRDR
jgi:uncharacterized protein YdeI (YjbR/CyaY-like superfamily)